MIFQDFGADQGKRQWSDLRYLSVLNPTRHVAIHLICGLFVTIFGQQIAIRKPLIRKYSIVYYYLVECFLTSLVGCWLTLECRKVYHTNVSLLDSLTSSVVLSERVSKPDIIICLN